MGSTSTRTARSDMPILTEDDKKILPLALRQNGGFHLATQWYCRDFDPLPYQYAFHQSLVPNVTFIAGIAAGKTFAVAASFFIDMLTTPFFRGLNTSVTAKQAELPFEMVQLWIDDNPRVDHLIKDISLRPYPKITFQNFAEWHFRTAGTDAKYIRGQEFDRINYDEAGLDFNGEAAKVLRGRLRGTRVDGTRRMARMDVITSPTGAPWLRERFDRGDPEHMTYRKGQYHSMRIETYQNTRLTKEQIALMEADYPAEMIDVELRGFFPDYGVSMFPIGHIHAAVEQGLYDTIRELTHDQPKPRAGYELVESPRFGVMKYELPAQEGRIYILAGDPGTDNPPRRNSPCVMVVDATDDKMEVVYFDWIAGKGSYMPFLNSFKYAMMKYNPVFNGLDKTGPQKALDELAFENMGLDVDGLNFNADKSAMLNSLSLSLTQGKWKYPPIKGLIGQMSTYTEENDRNKLPQDIVMTMAMIAFLERYKPSEAQPSGQTRNVPKNRMVRTQRSRRR